MDALIVMVIGIGILVLTVLIWKAPLSMWAIWSRKADTKNNVRNFNLVWFAVFGFVITLLGLWKFISGRQ